jgi:hypothetical protein
MLDRSDLGEEAMLLLRSFELLNKLKDRDDGIARHCADYLGNLLRIAAITGHIDLKYLKQVVDNYEKDPLNLGVEFGRRQ